MSYRFHDYWITETLRLRESLWGPFEDASESGRARTQESGFTDRVVFRARLLAEREGLDTVIHRWQHVSRLLWMGFMLAAVLAGITAASAALGSGTEPVNLALALTGLLGLNALTLLLWLASFSMQGGSTGTLLADLWLGLTRRLARGPDAVLAPRALLELLSRHGLTRWCAGALSHALWTLALVSCLFTLMGLLSVRSYTFQWETTLLSPDTFVTVVHGLGALPALLGFPLPDAEIIRASNGQNSLPGGAQALWSGWLLGMVVVYGLLPRLVALVASGWVVRSRARHMTLDPSLPGIAELHDRLTPQRTLTGIDAPAPSAEAKNLLASHVSNHIGEHGLAGIELPEDIEWPPFPVPTGMRDMGVIDTREQRRYMLDTLRRNPSKRLLAVCDARQTPDRGSLALLAELASLAETLHVLLLPDGNAAARRPQWHEQLNAAGLSPDQLHADTISARAWVEGNPTGQPGAVGPLDKGAAS